jgi:hypothetical protein
MNDSPSIQGELSQIESSIRQLLRTVGYSEDYRAMPVSGGRNNRLYHISAGGNSAALKWYYSDENESRDRLAAEFQFCSFCLEHEIHVVPNPLATDPEGRVALYEWVDGTPVTAVGEDYVGQAVDFIVRLNAQRRASSSKKLGNASEACFRVDSHLGCVGRRVQRLAVSQATAPVHREASRFVNAQLLPAWRRIEAECGRSVPGDSKLGSLDRCISPSDFGFHNALVSDKGELTFLDFEYAGWDDPAKLVCDFFCQVELPVPRRHWAEVVDALASHTQHAEDFRRRCLALFPVYQVKWACIVLNYFLPEHAPRREFSSLESPSDDRLREQLAKAEEIVRRIEA